MRRGSAREESARGLEKEGKRKKNSLQEKKERKQGGKGTKCASP